MIIIHHIIIIINTVCLFLGQSPVPLYKTLFFSVFLLYRCSALRSWWVFVKVIYTHFMYEFLMMLAEWFEPCLYIPQQPVRWIMYNG